VEIFINESSTCVDLVYPELIFSSGNKTIEAGTMERRENAWQRENGLCGWIEVHR
jgi:hypothetical protein